MSRKRPERRDLAGLLGHAQELTQPGSGARALALSELRPYQGQPRRHFDPEELAALTRSIQQKGVLQPLLVRPAKGFYEIAAGERRYRAALAAGLTEVPALVRELNDQEMLEVGLIENLRRENLTPLDEIEATLRLTALRLGTTPEDARTRLMSALRRPEAGDTEVFTEVFGLAARESWQSFAKNKLRVLGWPQEVLEAMRTQGLSYTVAGVVAAADPQHRPALLKLALSGASRGQLRSYLREQASPVAPENLVAPRQVGRLLADTRWVAGLGTAQQAELRQWLSRTPAFLKEQVSVEAPTPRKKKH
ncbi:ParB/RepB/Spo0J family partition protein [Deinococcus lacus]|uniref:ParB/RepB/Spo0J family partition protein n=1 Tax=Deinococcus lacus TaxID=392561 RepID=A0ABW1YFN2_9DEIO